MSWECEQMTEVPRDIFIGFLGTKETEKIQGEIFHSEYWVDKNTQEKIAYMETSSWGAEDIYKIKENEGYSLNNLKVANLVSKIINSKQ